MKLYDVSQLPVMDGERIVGIVDESDVLLHVYGDEARFREPVSTAMVSKLDKVDGAGADRVAAAGLRSRPCRHRDGRRALPRPDHPHRPAQFPAPARAVTADRSPSKFRKESRCRRQHLALATRAIHGGQSPDPSTGAVMPPIYATSTYAQSSPGVHQGFEYSRTHNPTRFAYERCIASLEGGSRGFAFASGLAATSTLLELLDSGDHVIAMDDIYGGSYRLFERVRRRSAGLDFSFVDLTDAGGVRSRDHAEDEAGLDRNPDQPAAEDRRHRRDCRDREKARACWSRSTTPLRRRSCSGRWSTAPTSSCIRRPSTSTAIPTWSAACWWSVTTPSSASSWRSCRTRWARCRGRSTASWRCAGLKTLHLRMRAHCENALALAQWLQTHAAGQRRDPSGTAVASAPRARRAADGRLRRHAVDPRSRAASRRPSASASGWNCSPWPNRSAAWSRWSITRR